jgi:hypothetical protein
MKSSWLGKIVIGAEGYMSRWLRKMLTMRLLPKKFLKSRKVTNWLACYEICCDGQERFLLKRRLVILLAMQEQRGCCLAG